MKSLLDLVKALFGPKAISSTIGTRTNIIRLPSGKLQKYVSTDLNVEAASDAAAINAYKEMEQLVADIPKMNDAERLIFEGNLRRLKNKLENSGLIQKENVSSGITELESKVEQLKQKGRELEKVTGEKVTLTDVLKDFAGGQKGMARLQDEGLVRATARQIMYNDIKSGKLKVSKEVEDIILGRASGDPIDSFRRIYGENALEQLDSLTPDLRQLKTEVEAEKLARSKFKFEPDINRPPGSVSIEEAKKAEQEFGINKPAKVTDLKTEATRRTSVDDLIDEYNANQDRLLLTDDEGGTLITYPEYNRLKDRNEQIAKILEEKGIKSTPEVETKPEGIVIPFRKKPTEPEGKAEGGIIGYTNNINNQPLGLDYLMGTESPKEGYAGGGRIGFKSGSGGKKILDIIIETNKKLKGKKSMEKVNPKTGEVTTPTEPVKVAEKPIKEFTDDEMISYIKKYKEEGPTLEEFTKRVNEETGSNFTPEQLAHAYRVKVAYPHSTPIVDSEGKFIGGGLYNPPLDVSVSDRETLTKSIMQTRKSKELKPAEVVETPETPPKAGEGRFTKQEVLEKIIQSTIDANPTDEYVQTTFPNFIKEIRAKPELANNENVWRTFTQDFPDNKRLVVYGDDTVDFFTKGENLPEGMKQTTDLVNTYGISMEEARRIKQMEPEDQVMEIKKLQILKSRNQNANGGLNYLMGI